MEVAGQRFPAAHGVTHGLGEIGLAGEFRQGGFEPRLETGEQWQGLLFPASLPLIGRLAPDAALDAVERADAAERLPGER